VYTLSTTGVLTLFDTDAQKIHWKKELPNEHFKLRYLSRNLLAYSDTRALLINSASHVIYDVHFDAFLEPSSTPSPTLAVEFFELKGHVYGVFARASKVIVYKDYQLVGALNVPGNNLKEMRPLELIFDRLS
jgi:hypothetical protein